MEKQDGRRRAKAARSSSGRAISKSCRNIMRQHNRVEQDKGRTRAAAGSNCHKQIASPVAGCQLTVAKLV